MARNYSITWFEIYLKLHLDVYTPVDRNSDSELPCYCNMSGCSRVENDKTCVWGLAAKKDGFYVPVTLNSREMTVASE